MMRTLPFLLALCVTTSAAAQQRWATYANPRFGTTVDYPADLFPQRDPPPAGLAAFWQGNSFCDGPWMSRRVCWWQLAVPKEMTI